MDTISLKGVQGPLKQQYRDDPESAVVTLKADGELDGSGVACKVSTGQAMAEAGLHPATGGDGTQLCSGDMLLEALVACAGVTMRAVATSMEMNVSGTVTAEGDLDFRGTLGVAKDAPVGFRDIRLHFDVVTDAGEDQVASLIKLTERYCVVLQTIKGSASTEVSVATSS
ncbi:MAG: OsmC family protein [Pseudonocardia sp.]|nr:OsmC family protein [Pseudonocardia sp.]